MKIYMKMIMLALISVSLFVSSVSLACTIFTVKHGDNVMFGGNEDQYPNSSYLVVDNTGSLGVVYFATPWKKWPLVMQMGINEMGLCYDTNWIPEEKLNPHPERKAQNRWAVIQIMKNSSTVEDVLSNIFTFNWGKSISYQVHFADKFGDAVVIHPGKDGELIYTRKPKGNGYLVSTNFNLAQLNSGDWSCHRYAIANKMIANIGAQSDLTVEFMASVLNATHQDNFMVNTLYSAVYDLIKLRIYLFYNHQFDEPYPLDLKEELSKTKNYRKVSIKELLYSK